MHGLCRTYSIWGSGLRVEGLLRRLGFRVRCKVQGCLGLGVQSRFSREGLFFWSFFFGSVSRFLPRKHDVPYILHGCVPDSQVRRKQDGKETRKEERKKRKGGKEGRKEEGRKEEAKTRKTARKKAERKKGRKQRRYEGRHSSSLPNPYCGHCVYKGGGASHPQPPCSSFF